LLEARRRAIVVNFHGMLIADSSAKLDAGVKHLLRGAMGTRFSLAMTTSMQSECPTAIAGA
jgi:hypothetical protein